MRRRLVTLAYVLVALVAARAVAQTPSPPLGIGRPATAEDIRVLDIDVMPDGRGLPAGEGPRPKAPPSTRRNAPRATAPREKAGPRSGSPDERPATVSRLRPMRASCERSAATGPTRRRLYDYTARAMPFQQPGTLTPDETYGLVAYLLFLNGVIAEDAVMDQSSLPKVQDAGSRPLRSRQSTRRP